MKEKKNSAFSKTTYKQIYEKRAGNLTATYAILNTLQEDCTDRIPTVCYRKYYLSYHVFFWMKMINAPRLVNTEKINLQLLAVIETPRSCFSKYKP